MRDWLFNKEVTWHDLLMCYITIDRVRKRRDEVRWCKSVSRAHGKEVERLVHGPETTASSALLAQCLTVESVSRQAWVWSPSLRDELITYPPSTRGWATARGPRASSVYSVTDSSRAIKRNVSAFYYFHVRKKKR